MQKAEQFQRTKTKLTASLFIFFFIVGLIIIGVYKKDTLKETVQDNVKEIKQKWPDWVSGSETVTLEESTTFVYDSTVTTDSMNKLADILKSKPSFENSVKTDQNLSSSKISPTVPTKMTTQQILTPSKTPIQAEPSYKGWLVFDEKDCDGNDLKRYARVDSLELCILLCEKLPESDALTWVPPKGFNYLFKGCFCKRKGCANLAPMTRFKNEGSKSAKRQDGPRLDDIVNCQTLSLYRAGQDYQGNVSVTKSGHKCANWQSYPRYTHYGDHNYCRNDLMPYNGGAWCFKIKPWTGSRWDYCSIQDCSSLIKSWPMIPNKNGKSLQTSTVSISQTSTDSTTTAAKIKTTTNVTKTTESIEKCGNCKTGWKRILYGHKYHCIKKFWEMEISQAQRFCAKNNAKLPEPMNSKEDKALRDAYSDKEAKKIALGFKFINNQYITTNGKKLFYTNWKQGEPSAGDSYVAMKKYGTWVDYPAGVSDVTVICQAICE